MDSLIATLLDSVLQPGVLLAAAATTLLLFSGAIGWALDLLHGHRLPLERGRFWTDRSDTTPEDAPQAAGGRIVKTLPARRFELPPRIPSTAFGRQHTAIHSIRGRRAARARSGRPHRSAMDPDPARSPWERGTSHIGHAVDPGPAGVYSAPAIRRSRRRDRSAVPSPCLAV